MNKKKIINDPLYGFITIRSELIFDIITHPWFQRLRHIRQLGLTEFVYPGALHTRFQHALGAMHLMGRALDTLRNRGIEISEQEYEAAQLAILLHDMGHGPFSHSLEETLLDGVHHESISYRFMQELNRQFDGALGMTLEMFRNSYPRKFFHALVSSQLDMDRLDYLNRDSFFTGVQEGRIGVDRIIAMLNVHDDELVVEEKGIYSIENFLSARRLMYWQVYLHKTTVSVERMLINLIRRARDLVVSGHKLNASEALTLFLKAPVGLEAFRDTHTLEAFGSLDDHDVWGALKMWQTDGDPILSALCRMIIERKIFRIVLSNEPVSKTQVEQVRRMVTRHYNILRSESVYLFSLGTVTNEAYTEGQKIHILTRQGKRVDVAQASDLPNIKALSKIVKKNYLCWPKHLSL
ncbi:MAG TPA: HD domain-containing protein [Cyclobacteriaceae bacterium]